MKTIEICLNIALLFVLLVPTIYDQIATFFYFKLGYDKFELNW